MYVSIDEKNLLEMKSHLMFFIHNYVRAGTRPPRLPMLLRVPTQAA